MRTFRLAPPRLGQLTELTSGITANLAREIVGRAEPAVRRIVREERNRFAEALIGGIPFAALAAMGYAGTRYLVPDETAAAKAVGYAASAASLAIGGWWTLSGLAEEAEAPPAPSTPAAPPPEIVRQAAEAIVAEAEPRVRGIVEEERERLAAALQAGLPLAAASAAAFLASAFLAEGRTMKAVGYSAAALLLGAGAWTALDRMKEAA